MVACIPLVWMGCQGCENASEAEAIRINQTNQNDLVYGGDPVPTPEEDAAVRRDVHNMTNASNVRDWEEHLKYYLPNIFKDSSDIVGWMKMAHHYDSIGWRTEFTELDITDVSPFVPYAEGRAAVVNANFTNIVYFTEDFKGIHGQYENMISGRYKGLATVEYDSLKQVYTIQGKDHWYAFEPDSLDGYYFVQGKSMTEHGVGQLFQSDDLQRLLSYRR